MRKLLTSVALSAAAFLAPAITMAAEEDWKDDPTVIFHAVDQKSCTKADAGKRDTMTLTVEIIAIKESWDKAMAGKSPAAQAALKKRMLDVGLQTLNTELRPRIADFTTKDIEDAYEKDREDHATDPYRRSTRAAYTKAQDEIKSKTGIEVMMGVDTYPVFTPGCTLK